MAVGLPVGAGLMVLSWITVRGASPLTGVAVVPAIVAGALPRLVTGPGYANYTASGMLLWLLVITAVSAALAIAIELWIALRDRSQSEPDPLAANRSVGEPAADETTEHDWIFDPEQR